VCRHTRLALSVPLSIRPAEPSDRAAILDLFSTVFSAAMSGEEWSWKYERCPHRAVSVCAFDGERLIGHYGGLGTRLYGAAGRVEAATAVDVMVAPAARRLGKRALFADLTAEFCRRNREAGLAFFFGFPNVRHLVVGERLGVGYERVEPAGLLARAPLPARRRLRLRAPRLSCGTRLSPAHDALAEALHARPGWRSERNRATLDWRLSDRPGAVYRIYELLDRRGRSVAMAAVRTVLARALLVDLQLLDEEDGSLAELLAGVSADLGASAQRLEVRAPAASLLTRRLVEELGFAPETSDTILGLRPLDPAFDAMSAARALDYRYLDHEIF
jgi:GNAT acetyltransferase-like protein